MALFGLGGKKAEQAPDTITPVDDVLRMRQQGFTNNQIVQSLQRNGYKTHQIFDAMNQADLKSAAPVDGAIDPELAGPPQMPSFPQEEVAPVVPQANPQPFPEPYNPPQPRSNQDAQMEELAEAMVEEKWEDLMKQFNKILEWRDDMAKRMGTLEQRFSDIDKKFGTLQQGILGKVSEYDKNIRTVGTDLKAMENVFQKVLPTLTDNVNELSRLTKKVKQKKT
jgi:DNA-binding transcriptional MerR regulator